MQKAAHLGSSSLMREGVSISLLNISSRAVSFVASAFAAQCVGASNFGVSGIIITWAMQVSLLFHGGLDPIVSREIAQHPAQSRNLLTAVARFRLSIALLLALLWVIITRLLVLAEQWAVWQLGAVLLLCNALNLVYFFQGLGKLRTLNLITAISSLLTALIYSTFLPKMPLGSDLVVFVGLNVLSTAATWLVASMIIAPSHSPKLHTHRVFQLLGTSWKYWLVAVAQFFYTNFQLLILSTAVPEQAIGAYRSALIIAGALDMVFSSFYNLLLPRFVECHAAGEAVFNRERRNMLWLFVAIGIVPTGALILSSSIIYDVLFGAEFAGGSFPLVFLACAKFINFIGQIYAYTLIVNKQDTAVMTGCLTGSLASIMLSLLLVRAYGTLAAAASTLLGEAIITALYLWFSLPKNTHRWSRVAR